MSAQIKAHALSAQQNADHKKLTEAISKNVLDQGVEQQRFKRTIDDQRKFVNNMQGDVGTIMRRQRSLAQSLTEDHRNFRNQILLQGRHQEESFKNSGRTMIQMQANVQQINSQVEVLLALERSMAGSVFSLSRWSHTQADFCRGQSQYQQNLLHQLLENATHNQTVIQNQREMLAELRDIATIVRVNQAIPAQVPLSTPVILLDARGQCAPFHLEFVNSAEVCAHFGTIRNDLEQLTLSLQVFLAVLKARFKDIGLRRIENGQFALEDTLRKKSLQLSDAWSTIVRPGQHISMSMVFRLNETSNTSCPWCKHENDSADETEVEW